MGQLEQAAVSEVKHPAPWEGATPEEDAAYNTQVEFGDTEFESEVGTYLGPYGREAVDADRATMLQKGGWELRGTFVKPDFDTDEDYRNRVTKRNKKVFEEADEKIEADMVYAVGPENANNRLWAHEFLHRFRGESRALGGEERFVRLFTAYRAHTADQWFDAVGSWLSMLLEDREALSYREAEKHLKRTLETWNNDFIRMEAEAAEEQGERPKTRKAFFDLMDFSDLKSDYRERAEGRENIRDIGKASHIKKRNQNGEEN